MDGVQLGLGGAVGVEVVVAPSEVLSVVDSEVHVVQGVVRRAVDELLSPMAGDHVAVVNDNGPDLHYDEEHEVQVLLNGEDEGENTVLRVSRELGSGSLAVELTGTAETDRSRPWGGKQARPRESGLWFG